MKHPQSNRQELQGVVQKAIDLLNDRPDYEKTVGLSAQSLPSLLERCQQMTKATTHSRDAPARTVHHLACTGGTLISRCLAALPNICLLSEVDPLSKINDHLKFTPTDVGQLSRNATRPVSQETQIKIFLSGINIVRYDCFNRGCDLVLRDHAHSAFNHGDYKPERPTLYDVLQPHMPLRSLVTVRHPLDSYLSLLQLGWDKYFSPSSLEGYAQRYHLFLDRHMAHDIMRYEDFVAAPEERLRQACKTLELTYSDSFSVFFQAIQLSGNSGRGGSWITSHSRRDVSDFVDKQRYSSSAYMTLCARLDYDI